MLLSKKYISDNVHFSIFFEQVIKPTLSKWAESGKIHFVAAGEFHTLYLTKKGHLYSCGSNEVGQLGRQTESNDGQMPGIYIS